MIDNGATVGGIDIHTFLDRLGDAIKSAFGKKAPEVSPASTNLTVFKTSDGVWKWIGTFTNNFRDDDFPVQEIFSANSHRRYVNAVNSGEKALPYLYIYHEERWKVGKAQFVALDEVEGDDDIVFVVAGGEFDADKYYVAEHIAKSGHPWQMSHGVPVQEISRNKDDMTVYEEYWSEEISIVPNGRAANQLTTFGVITGDQEMIDQKKRDEIISAMNLPDGSLLDTIESANKNVADKAREHIEFKAKGEKPVDDEEEEEDMKESKKETGNVEQPQAQEAPQVESASVEPEQAEAPDVITDSQFITDALLDIGKSLKAVSEAIVQQNDRIKSMETQMEAVEKEKQEATRKKEKEELAPTSYDVFKNLMKGVTSSTEALINEDNQPDSELVKQAPKEAEPVKKQAPMSISFVDDLIAKSNGVVKE